MECAVAGACGLAQVESCYSHVESPVARASLATALCPTRMPHPDGTAFEDQSVCLLNFFFMSGANSPIVFITTPTQACVITL
jgi:hypothetical protein